MTPSDLVEALDRHSQWLQNKNGGSPADLALQSLYGFDLTGVNLHRAKLTGVDFSQATNLANADLRGADFGDSDTSLANMEGAEFLRSKENLPKKIQDVLQKHYIWIESNGARGERADLSGEDLSHTDLGDVNLSAAVLKNASLVKTELKGASFLMSDLTETDLSGANLSDAVMAGSNFAKAKFAGANLNNANMGPTDLLDAAGKPTGREWPTNLTEVDFTGADLTSTNLRNALITGANFTGATLVDTRFGEADVKSAIIDRDAAKKLLGTA